MRRQIFKILYLLAVFFLALAVFLRFSEQENTDQTSVMGSATLPLVRVLLPDTAEEAATLRGYLDDMSVPSMRGGIIPVASERRVSIRIATYGEPLDGLLFEVRDIAGENLVEQTAVTERRETEYGDIVADLTLKDLLTPGEEYMLILRADIAGRTVSYYTRIVYVSDREAAAVSDSLAFARRFHENTLDKSHKEEIIPYIEPDRSGDNSTFAHVDIHSSYAQISWGDLMILTHDVPAAQITEIRGDVVSLVLTGSMVLGGEDGENRACDVTECFRLRRGEQRMYLLGYDREVRYRFEGAAADFGSDRIYLGIGPEEIPLAENEDGNTVAFVAGGRLFSFDKESGEMGILFSFSDSENGDERCTWQGHDIHILQVDAGGNVSFLVAGYMNRGEHEGRVGTALYRYDRSIRQLQELTFLPVDVSPEILRADVRRMSHIGGGDELYLMLGDDVVMIDPARDAVQTVIRGAAQTPYFRSASGALFARADGVLGDRITVTQFHTGENDEVKAEPGTRVMPLGFMQEDLVYGVVRDEDVRRDPAGGDIYAMETVRIRDVQGNILENYVSPGNFVVDAEVSGNQIRLHRVRLNEDTGYYEDTEDDQIINTLEAKSRINRVLAVVTQTWEKIIAIDLRQEVDGRTVKAIRPGLVLDEESTDVPIYKGAGNNQGFYVYARDGSVAAICAEEAAAVTLADGMSAVVVDRNDRYVWERRGLQSKNQIMAITNAAKTQVPDEDNAAEFCLRLMTEHRGSSRDIRGMLAEGASLSEVLDRCLADCRSLSLTGCEMTSMLYYVDQDIPVLVSMRDGGALLLIGFNESELVIVDPLKNADERVYKITRSQGIRLFKENGNRFLTYYVNSPAL